MVTAPTFVGDAPVTSFLTAAAGGKSSPNITAQANDVLVCAATSEDSAELLGTPTGGTSVTWTLQQSITVASYCAVYVWTTIVASGQTFAVTVTPGGGTRTDLEFGFDVYQFRGSDGIGASAKVNLVTGGPSVSLNPSSFDNSAVVCIASDWNSVDGTTRTWRTANSITPTAGNGLERVYARDATGYTTYGAYYSDIGAAGLKTFGLSAPSTMKYATAVVEIRGSTPAVTRVPRSPLVVPTAAAVRAATW